MIWKIHQLYVDKICLLFTIDEQSKLLLLFLFDKCFFEPKKLWNFLFSKCKFNYLMLPVFYISKLYLKYIFKKGVNFFFINSVLWFQNFPEFPNKQKFPKFSKKKTFRSWRGENSRKKENRKNWKLVFFLDKFCPFFNQKFREFSGFS